MSNHTGPKLSRRAVVIMSMNGETPNTPHTLLQSTMRNRKPILSRRSPAYLRSRSASSRAGFTLLELLLVLAILVVIGGIALPNFMGAGQEARINTTKVQLDSLKQSIQMYQIRMNSLPESLEALRDGPSDAAQKAKWVAPIINDVPTDAWENELIYTVNGNTYEIRSGGADGQNNTDDDIILESS